MGRAKEIIVRVIPANIANEFIKRHHYSGKVVQNSKLHFGVFFENKLHGVMSYGSSINKRGTINLVKGTKWNEFIELNRMAFDDVLPRNSESRAISLSIKLIKKYAPHIKWIISFADGTQCGDGTIYRASNFILTDIRVNEALRINPLTGEKVHKITAYHNQIKEFSKWEAIKGFQFRYIYFIDKSYRKRLTVPEIPFTKIDEVGAGMYKGKNIERKERHKPCEAQLKKQI